MNVLCETQNNEQALVVHFMWEIQACKPELMEHVLCETQAYNKVLIVNVLERHPCNRGHRCLDLLYKVHAFKSALTVNLQCSIPNSKHVLWEMHTWNFGDACVKPSNHVSYVVEDSHH